MAKRNPFAAIAHGHDLAEAIVDAIREPLLVLDPDLRVIAASRSFYRTFAVTPRKTEGQLLFELGDGQWNIPGLRTLLEDIIPKRRTVEAYEVEHEFPSIGRRVMLLNARRVFDEDGSASAILLAIEDVTRRREADREKDELLQAKGNSAPGDAAPRCQQSSDHRQHSSAQGQDRAIGGDASAPPRCPPARHVGGNGATTAARLWAERKDRDRALSDQAVRQSCSVDGRRTPAALDQGASDLWQGGIQRSCEPRADRDGARDQRLEAWLPGRSGGRNPGQLRRARFWLAPLGFRQWIGAQEASGEPPHIGLGTSIVEALAHQLEATVQKTSGPEGTTVTITAPAHAGVATGGRMGVGA